jgi:hypothetical protein
MDTRIENILNDLYKIDPQFKAHEKELTSLVSELILNKPDTHFDEAFAARLRSELLETKIRPVPTPYGSFFFSRAFYGVVGSALTVLFVVPFTFIATQRATSPEKPVVLNPFVAQVKDETAVLTPKQQISNKGINAFGTLALLPTDTVASQSTTADTHPTLKSVPPTNSLVAPSTSTAQVSYKGEQLSLKDTEGQVFKRTKGIDSGKQLADIIQVSNFGLAKISSFTNLHVSTIQLNESKADGYAVSVNFDEGAINISANSLAQPSETADTSSIISIADAFVKDHSIDMAVYGKGVVQNGYVVYPLIIDSKPVHDETGVVYGLMVSVDAKTKKVLSVSNLTSQTYDGSVYPLETNFSTLVKAATSSLATSATLGTPERVLMHHNDLYIPALSFPITYSVKNAHGMPTSVVVPLVKDFLAKQQPGADSPTTTIKGGATEPAVSKPQ